MSFFVAGVFYRLISLDFANDSLVRDDSGARWSMIQLHDVGHLHVLVTMSVVFMLLGLVLQKKSSADLP